jgi:hypothetical protein
VGFVVDKAALGQVFSEYFGFACQSFHRFLHYHYHPGLTNRPLSGRSVEWTLIPPPTMQIKKKLVKSNFMKALIEFFLLLLIGAATFCLSLNICKMKPIL